MDPHATKLAYWLLADDRLDLGKNPAKLDSFRAHFKHSLLFQPHLVVPDSYAINNLNFRTALRDDGDFRALVTDQVLSIACRADESGRVLTLREVRDGMSPDQQPREFSPAAYRSDEELLALDELAPRLAYSADEVARRYGEKARQIFDTDIARRKVENDELLATITAILAEQASGSAEPLGLAFFFYELGPEVERRMTIDWERYRSSVLDLATAPYFTALPSLLEADPVYAREHAGAFELSSGRSGVTQDIDTFDLTSRLGLASFEKGIGLLSRDSILKLLDSEEAKRFTDSLVNVEKEADIDEIKNAIAAYQRRIDEEILDQHSGLGLGSNDGREKRLTTSILETLGDVHPLISLGYASVGFGLLGLLFTRPCKKLIARVTGSEEREAARARAAETSRTDHAEQLAKTVTEWWSNGEPQIGAQAVLSSTGREVLYKGVL